MRNSTPTHYAITQQQAGEIQRYANYADAILTLISHDYLDGINGESDDFLTSPQHIRTALNAVSYFVKEIEKNAKDGTHIRLEPQAFKAGTQQKLARIEQERLAQTAKGGENE